MAFQAKRNHDTVVLKAAINLSSSIHRLVRQSGSLAVLCTAREMPMGILQNSPTSNQNAVIDVSPGLHPVVYGTSVNAGAFIASDGSGRAVAITPIEGAIASGNTGAFMAGKSIRKLTSAGEKGEIYFQPGFIVV